MEGDKKLLTLLLDAMSLQLAKESGKGMSRSEALNNKKCVLCGKDAVKFKDDLSKKEFKISGMCQVCQDYHFE